MTPNPIFTPVVEKRKKNPAPPIDLKCLLVWIKYVARLKNEEMDEYFDGLPKTFKEKLGTFSNNDYIQKFTKAMDKKNLDFKTILKMLKDNSNNVIALPMVVIDNTEPTVQGYFNAIQEQLKKCNSSVSVSNQARREIAINLEKLKNSYGLNQRSKFYTELAKLQISQR